jgi:heavy metal-binding protein
MENQNPIPAATPRMAILASRLLLLLFAGFAAGGAALIVLRDRAAAAPAARYVCPMHPEVRAAAKGQCPICHMALEPTNRDAGALQPSAAVPDTTAVENVRKHRIMDFVKKRSLLLPVQDLRGPAWVESDGSVTAVFYQDQLAVIAAGDRASFSATGDPTAVVSLRRSGDAALPWDDSTVRIRFRPDANQPLQAGQVGWVELPRKPREVLTVPASAVVNSPDGPYVLAATAGYGFEKRPVQIGETFVKQGFAVVLSGLSLHDRIVSRATFFLDADRRLGLDEGGEGLGEP